MKLLAYLAAATVVAGVTIHAIETLRTHGITIPMPNRDRKNEKNRNYKVYTSYYRQPYDSHWYVWKYGITGQKDADARAKSPRSARCRAECRGE